MEAPDRGAAAELQDTDVSERTQLREFVGEMQHAIDHGVLRKESACSLRVRQQEHRTAGHVRQGLELMQELLELTVARGRFLRGDQAVHDEQGCLELLDRAANQRHECVQAIRFQRGVSADVIDPIGNGRFVEESHPFQVRKHPRMRFREQRHIDGMSAAGRMIEARLIRQNRLACSGRTLDDVDAGCKKSSLENLIETFDPGRAALGR
jgi:hypothetical protein